MRLSERRLEGPFGDHTGFYTPPDYFPVFHVTAITHKRGAIYRRRLSASRQWKTTGWAKATERLFLPLLQLFQGEIADFDMPAGASFTTRSSPASPRATPCARGVYGIWSIGR